MKNWGLFCVVAVIALSSVILTLLVLLSKKSQVKNSFIYSFIVNLICVSCIHSVSFAIYWNAQESSLLCQFQSVLMILSCQSQEIWIIFITFICYQGVVNMKLYNYKQNCGLLTLLCSLGYFIPFVVLLILLLLPNGDRLGKWNNYCWIKYNKESINLKLAILYIPKLTYIAINLIIWIVLLCRINQMKKEHKIEEDIIKFGHKTFGFAVIEITCNLIAFSIRCVNQTNPKNESNETGSSDNTIDLSIISIIASCLQGVAYPIFVGWYTELLCKCGKESSKSENQVTSFAIENKDNIDISLRALSNDNPEIEKGISNVDNDNLISPSEKEPSINTSIDYYN